jgi:hypothetical protein
MQLGWARPRARQSCISPGSHEAESRVRENESRGRGSEQEQERNGILEYGESRASPRSSSRWRTSARLPSSQTSTFADLQQQRPRGRQVASRRRRNERERERERVPLRPRSPPRPRSWPTRLAAARRNASTTSTQSRRSERIDRACCEAVSAASSPSQQRRAQARSGTKPLGRRETPEAALEFTPTNLKVAEVVRVLQRVELIRVGRHRGSATAAREARKATLRVAQRACNNAQLRQVR